MEDDILETLTPEQIKKLNLVKILVGDVPQSLFYPALSDEEYVAILEYSGWNVSRAVRRAGMSIALSLTSFPYRERSGDIEVWNNASLQYGKFLQDLLDDNSQINIPDDLVPFGAASKTNPLAHITQCEPWYTKRLCWWRNVRGYPELLNGCSCC